MGKAIACGLVDEAPKAMRMAPVSRAAGKAGPVVRTMAGAVIKFGSEKSMPVDDSAAAKSCEPIEDVAEGGIGCVVLAWPEGANTALNQLESYTDYTSLYAHVRRIL